MTRDADEPMGKECGTAEFCSADGLSRYETALCRHRVLAEAAVAGVAELPQDMLDSAANRAAEEAGDCIGRLCNTFPMAAIQNGPAGKKQPLPRFFGNKEDSDS